MTKQKLTEGLLGFAIVAMLIGACSKDEPTVPEVKKEVAPIFQPSELNKEVEVISTKNSIVVYHLKTTLTSYETGTPVTNVYWDIEQMDCNKQIYRSQDSPSVCKPTTEYGIEMETCKSKFDNSQKLPLLNKWSDHWDKLGPLVKSQVEIFNQVCSMVK